MKVDYFGDLLHTVPSVPGSEKQTGGDVKPNGSKSSPASPVSPAQKAKADEKEERPICHGCRSHEVLIIGGKDVAGCLLFDSSPWREEWRRLDTLATCPRRMH